MGTSAWFGLTLVAIGVITALRASKVAKDAEERLQSGEDRYFEERRELEAYPRQRDPVRIRRGGWFMIAAGIVLIALDALVIS